MPVYTCECCNFNTMIKPHYERHMLTKKHLAISENKQDSDDEKVQCQMDIYTEIDNLKKKYDKDIAELKAENKAIINCLQEYKQLVSDMSKLMPTSTPEPQTIVIQQTPVVVQKTTTGCPHTTTGIMGCPHTSEESCNPRHIEKKLDIDPVNQSVPDIDVYFKIKSEHTEFNFDEIDDMIGVDRRYIINKIVNFVKDNIRNNVQMPFKYIKSSWFVKFPSGWEKIEQPNNKGKLADSESYQHNVIVSCFIFIIQNRFVSYFNEVSPEWQMKNKEFSRLFSEVFGVQNYKNNDLLSPLQDAFGRDPSCDERAFYGE